MAQWAKKAQSYLSYGSWQVSEVIDPELARSDESATLGSVGSYLTTLKELAYLTCPRDQQFWRELH